MYKSESNYINQIKALLAKSGLTQMELAQQLDVTYAALNRWLHGHAVPRKAKIQQISKLYKEKVGYPSITPKELSKHLKAADSLRRNGIWDLVKKKTPLQDELLLEHTYNSTAIEGTTFTKKETEAVIFDKSLIENKPFKEHLEVTNYAVLIRDIFEKKYLKFLSENLIKAFHKIILQGIREDAGEYAAHHRRIRGVDIALPHPEDIPEEIKNLLNEWNLRSKTKSVIEKIADFHANFEWIHSFGDGNGRVGRAIMMHQCLQYGYPPAIIENKRKAEYYEVLEYAQRTRS